jgi:hypothetical protein
VTEEALDNLADAWIRYYHAPEGSAERFETSWAATEETSLLFLGKRSEELWQLILKIHERDQSIVIQRMLSAGAVEGLMARFGERYIDRVEEKARKDPAFAKLLGGVWRNSISDEIWSRLQAVCDHKGWSGMQQ